MDKHDACGGFGRAKAIEFTGALNGQGRGRGGGGGGSTQGAKEKRAFLI